MSLHFQGKSIVYQILVVKGQLIGDQRINSSGDCASPRFFLSQVRFLSQVCFPSLVYFLSLLCKFIPSSYSPSLLTSRVFVPHREGWRTAVRRVKTQLHQQAQLCQPFHYARTYVSLQRNICLSIEKHKFHYSEKFAGVRFRTLRPQKHAPSSSVILPFILSTPPSHPQYSSPLFLGIVPYIPVLIPLFLPYSFLVLQHLIPISQSMSLHCK